MNRNRWSNDDIAFLFQNREKLSYKEISKKINRQETAIRTFVSTHGWGHRCTLDRDFFKTWTPKMAYVLGFLSADDCITEPKHQISFCNTDLQILKDIRYAMGSSHVISPCKSNESQWFNYVISNKEMYADLIEKGITPRKSTTLQFSDVPEFLLFDYIRGFFDGDGCFHIAKNKHKKQQYLAATFYSCSFDFISILKNRLEKYFNFEKNHICTREHPRNGTHPIHTFGFAGRKAIRLGDLMYQNSSIHLNRKYNIYSNFKIIE